MNFIKANFKMVIFILLALLLVGGGFYYTQILTPQLETFQEIKAENQIKNDELEHLREEFKSLEQRKNALEDIKMQTKSLEEKVPTYEVAVMMMSEVMQYMDIYNFQETSVEVGMPLNQEDQEDRGYDTVPVSIKHKASYEECVKLLEMINRSYHMITIDSFSIDNAIQEQNKEEQVEVISKDTVESEIVLHMHYKGQTDLEVYPNFMAYLEKEDNIFARPIEITNENQEENQEKQQKKEEDQKKDKATSASSQSSKNTSETNFSIHLADILRSGDNYSFSGYSSDEAPVYVGLTSSKDTRIVLTISDYGYTCLIEDAQGNKNEKKVEGKTVNPSVTITSQIQNIMEEMPTASIYIRNYTQKVIDVNVRGTSLENIVIYNENNQLVEPGNQLGKIAVIR